MCMGETKQSPSSTPLSRTMRSTSSVMWTISRRLRVWISRDRGWGRQPRALVARAEEEVRVLLRPSGYMVRKTAAIRAFLGFLFAEAGGSFERLAAMRTEVLRPKLLALPGVGPETADAILLYALGHEAMVVDEYLRRGGARDWGTGGGAEYGR